LASRVAKAKCDYILRELGFDAAVDDKAGHLEADLRKACPKGIDVYFESVEGMILHAIILLLAQFMT